MTQFSVYSTSTGEILRSGTSGRNNISKQLKDDDEAAIMVAADDSLEKVHSGTGEVVRKEYVCKPLEGDTIQADGKQAFRVPGLISCVNCHISGPLEAEGEIEDGELIFTTDKPGRYIITLSAAGCLSREVEVHAV